MSLKLVDLRAARQKPVVDLLKDILAKAEAGEIEDIAVSWTTPNRGGSYTTTSFVDYLKLLGAVTLLQHDLLHEGNVPGID